MGATDYLILIVYFAIVIGLGIWAKRRASKSLEAYFLAGQGMPWPLLAMSGSISNFDITGTMWIVSVIFLLGMKSMWHHWMWGFLMGAFFFAYMGGWVRRSSVMTAAEWMKTRFGDGPGGKLARTSYALMAVVTLAAFLAYAYQGIGKFAEVYLPLETLAQDDTLPSWLSDLVLHHEADLLACLIIGITTFYVVLGGLMSVVMTNVIQTVILTLGCIYIAVMAWAKMTPDRLARLPEGFTSLGFSWRLPEFAGTDNAMFELFGALVLLWVVKGLLLNLGGPGQMYDFQLFLSARSPRDAAKVGAAWSFFLIVRWAMTMGIALLALTGLTGGVTDSEVVMPVVLNELLPTGIRGLVTAGLLAAFMSTFAATVNSGASFVVRDLWQPLAGVGASDRRAVRAGYVATFGLVVAGSIVGSQVGSIAQIWGWIMMVLGGGVIVPNVLRWYWWRMNGWGYGAGMLGGILLAAVAPLLSGSILVQFPVVALGSLVLSLAGTYATRPTALETLKGFYRTVRPFGRWGPVKSSVVGEGILGPREPVGRTALNVILGMVVIFGVYVAPMYLVAHSYGHAAVWLGAGLVAVAVLKRTWYDRLDGQS